MDKGAEGKNALILFSHSNKERGGAEYVFKNVCNSLGEKYDLKIVKPKDKKNPQLVCTDNNMIIHFSYNQFYNEKWYISITKIITNALVSLTARKVIDIQNTKGLYVSSSSCCFGLILSAGFKSNNILHIHEFPEHNFIQKIFFHWFFRMTQKNTNIIFVSLALKNAWEKMYGLIGIRSYILYNPVKNINFIKKKGAHKEFVFGFMGALEKNKRIIELIDTFIKLTRQMTKTRIALYIAGEGPFEDEVKKLASERDDIVCMGYVSNVSVFYESIDTLIVSSKYESFSLAAAEAIKAGRPVILHQRIGIFELLENNETALIYDYENEEGLFDAMCKISSDRELYEYISKNTQKIRNIFPTTESYGIKILGVCSEVFI